jgi:ATP-dependent DNA helicase RecQ
MGIAKPDVRAVIHYDMPKSLEGYYQESGRAGRDGLKAQCIFFYQYTDRTKLEFTITQKTDEQERRVARQQIQQVMDYGESTLCRRRVLLAYFGEEYQQENCGNCDNCLHPARRIEDCTIDAQKFLSCVSRTQQRFGMRHIIDILRGANTQKIRDLNHDQLTTYGIGKDLSVDAWMYLARSLLQQGLLTQTDDGYPVLKLNKLSLEILRRQRSVEIPAMPVSKQNTSDIIYSRITALEPEEMGLFEYLRSLRKRLADTQGVAPFVVFPNSSLLAMAQLRPQSREQFAKIPGVGVSKLEAYLTPFTEAIRDYCEQHNLAMGLELEPQKIEVASTPKVNISAPTRQLTLEMYRQGRSVEEIAEERNLKPDTIMGHLADLIEAGETIEIEQLIQPGHYDAIVDALRQADGRMLGTVKDVLGDEYSYGEIRIVRALVRRSQGTSV